MKALFAQEYEVYSQRFQKEALSEGDIFDPKVLPNEYLPKLYALPNSYYGLIRPGTPDDYCLRNSQQLLRNCNHDFGPQANPAKT
jgi:hypothetical protein